MSKLLVAAQNVELVETSFSSRNSEWLAKDFRFFRLQKSDKWVLRRKEDSIFFWYFGLSILQFGLQILILPLHTASPTLDPRSINICGFKTWWTADLRRKLSPTKAIPQNERRNIYQQYTMSYPKFKQNIWVKSHKIGRPKKIMLRSLVNELPEKSSAMIHTLLSLTWLRQITTFNM